MPDPATSHWRWNEFPDYHALTKEMLEQRLRIKFGNWKFYVDVSGSYPSGMSLSHLDSADRTIGGSGCLGILQR